MLVCNNVAAVCNIVAIFTNLINLVADFLQPCCRPTWLQTQFLQLHEHAHGMELRRDARGVSSEMRGVSSEIRGASCQMQGVSCEMRLVNAHCD